MRFEFWVWRWLYGSGSINKKSSLVNLSYSNKLSNLMVLNSSSLHSTVIYNCTIRHDAVCLICDKILITIATLCLSVFISLCTSVLLCLWLIPISSWSCTKRGESELRIIYFRTTLSYPPLQLCALAHQGSTRCPISCWLIKNQHSKAVFCWTVKEHVLSKKRTSYVW